MLSGSAGLSIDYTDPLLFTVAADLGDIHGMAQYGERMKLTGNLGPQLVTDLPQAFGQLVNEECHLSVAQLLVDPAGPFSEAEACLIPVVPPAQGKGVSD